MGTGWGMDNEPERVEDGSEGVADDLSSSLDPNTDLDELRNGGPTRTPGIMTTTGGTAGPASVAALRAPREGAAPTTTGDAGSGGMETVLGGSTSDATTTG
jgi:hypothetical protein